MTDRERVLAAYVYDTHRCVVGTPAKFAEYFWGCYNDYKAANPKIEWTLKHPDFVTFAKSIVDAYTLQERK